jgi:hypothetical protein
MIETGFNKTEIGKIILAACFVNDLGTVLALGVVFANFDYWLARRTGWWNSRRAKSWSSSDPSRWIDCLPALRSR